MVICHCELNSKLVHIRIEYFLIANLNHNFKSLHTCICGKMLMIIELPGLVDKALCFIWLDFSLNVA